MTVGQILFLLRLKIDGPSRVSVGAVASSGAKCAANYGSGLGTYRRYRGSLIRKVHLRCLRAYDTYSLFGFSGVSERRGRWNKSDSNIIHESQFEG